jgi:hypothetical protein
MIGIKKLTVVACCVFAIAAALLPSTAAAEYTIKPGSVKIQALDSSNGLDTRAGSHPDRLQVDFGLNVTRTGARDLVFEFAPGLTGSPLATPVCSRAVFELEDCPKDTEVGRFVGEFRGVENFNEAVFNLQPGPGQVALLGFHPLWLTELELKVRPDDFGLTIATHDMPELPVEHAQFELWGVPADHNNGGGEREAFLTMPGACGPMSFKMLTRSWEVGAPWLSEEAQSPPFTECESLPFEPSLDFNLTNPKPDSPTGAEIGLNLTEFAEPDGVASANMKDVHIDLPPGVSLSPAGTEGREACTDGQFGLGTESPVTCPFRSRVGTVKVETPALAEPLNGSMYLGQELPGERFRLLINAVGSGVNYKALATLNADQGTGQLSTELRGLPQFSVSRISMSFEGGSKALLATPLGCGPVTAKARFTPATGGAPVQAQRIVNVGSCGAPPFSPVTVAGVTEPNAGKTTGFALTLTRQEGEQLPKQYSVAMPPGLAANLNAVAICSSATAAAGACNDSSKVGSALAEVGSGPNPALLHGSVYLTGPYESAPFGLSIVFQAAIGPFNLGQLNVQATLEIDPHTGQVTLGHLLPSIFAGVPVRFRTLGLDLPPGFIVNPTSCESMKLNTNVISVDNRSAPLSIPFSVGGCNSLKFKPQFALALNQRGAHAKNPELSFGVRTNGGDANLQRFSVKFPKVVKFHNSGFKEICPRGDALEDHCRPGSQVGTAVAKSPLLPATLTGPVYLVQPKGKGVPDFWTTVQGMGVKLQMQGESSGKPGNLVTEVVGIPDLPLSSFTMNVNGGGKNGTLFSVDSTSCSKASALATPVELEGHQGSVETTSVKMKAACSKAKKAGGKKRSKKRARSRGR